jgi:hypothetical protein
MALPKQTHRSWSPSSKCTHLHQNPYTTPKNRHIWYDENRMDCSQPDVVFVVSVTAAKSPVVSCLWAQESSPSYQILGQVATATKVTVVSKAGSKRENWGTCLSQLSKHWAQSVKLHLVGPQSYLRWVRDTYSWQYKGIDNLGVQRAWSEHHECVSISEREVLGVGIGIFGGFQEQFYTL